MDAGVMRRDIAADPGSRAFLEAEGFAGFRTVGQLHADRCEEVPDRTGVYAVVRDGHDPPEFLVRSTAPTYRGMEPSLSEGARTDRWVPGAQVLYFGLALGPGVRNLLKQRVKRYLRFGHGRVVGHWDGRAIWQLRDRSTLQVAWKETGDHDPNHVEARLLALFRARYGALPFANLKQEIEG